LVTSSLIRGIQIGEISKLGWLIGFVKHAIRAEFLTPAVAFNFHNPDFIPDKPMALLVSMSG
jgi:hypothetical protein